MQRRTQALLIAAGLTFGAAAAGSASGPLVRGWVEAIASGSGTAASCNTTQTCITATGGGEASLSPRGRNQDGNGLPFPLGQYNFSASLTIDSGNARPNGFGGTCSAAGGTVTLTPAQGSAGNLVLDVQGTQCALGNSTTERVLSGTYAVDGASSSGVLSLAAGIGSFSMSANSTAATIALTLNFSGDLRFCEGVCFIVHP